MYELMNDGYKCKSSGKYTLKFCVHFVQENMKISWPEKQRNQWEWSNIRAM